MIWCRLIISNNSDETFISACKYGPGEKRSQGAITLENALKSVRFWYLRQCANQKEELVQRDLLTTLLEPLIEKRKVASYFCPFTEKGESCKSFKRYLRFILWSIVCLYRHNALQLFQSWIEMDKENK